MNWIIKKNGSDSELYHHGILGQRWGIRRFQNPDGSLKPAGEKRYSSPSDARIIAKDTKIHRISNNKEDATYDRKKYVSLTDEDNQKWLDYFKKGYGDRDVQLYDVMYRPTKDLKIAKSEKLGELFVDAMMNDKQFAQQILNDTEYAAESLGQTLDTDTDTALSYNLAMQTQSGKAFVDKLMKMGYDGVEDKHGRNVSSDPIIVFNPEKNLKKKSTKLA